MEKLTKTQNADFKPTMMSVLSELGKRKLKQKFYNKLGFSRSLVSQWKSGQKKLSFSQENHFIEVAVKLIEEFDKPSDSSRRHRDELLNKFQTLISA